MNWTDVFWVRDDPNPDFSNEEERAERAERLLDTVPELTAMDPIEGVVEACRRVGFRPFDCETLRLLARRTGNFPLSIERREGPPRYEMETGWAQDALRSSQEENPDFWEDDALVQEAARQAPCVWAKVKAELDREARRVERALSRSRP
ncbi:hypothetical protein roselon_00596 [Roseibacterium elongatum DSM 19469]|uniref:Uncharacterized protein n=1 Tax=Roseicyclus elongatus DSM 19469 TaxID=1294273 RepID=W8S2S2_9RHOB|nr:hypothetical protein [Roseibacterium elongatum]AHM03036.1 hypothetical protein roselon_00596 [Roseibacterium elongatum DSM 19469]